MPITKARPKKVPVTLDAALQRINRRLAGESSRRGPREIGGGATSAGSISWT